MLRQLHCLLVLFVLIGCSSTSRATRDASKLVEARQLTLRGLDAMQQNDWQTAEDLFRDAVAASPHDERAHLQYAKTLWYRGERSDSLKHMGEAARLSGDAPELLVELGRMQLAVDDLDAARRSGLEAAHSDPQYAAAHALVGDVLVRQGRLDKALESYHLALSLDGRQPSVLLGVADIYRTWDEPRRVLSTLQSLSAESLPPVLAGQTYYLRGVAEHRLGRHQEAITDLVQATRLISSADVHFALARAHQAAGNIDAAKVALQTALENDAHHGASRKLLAQLSTLPRFANQSSSTSLVPR